MSEVPLYHPVGNPGANFKSDTRRFHLREVAFERELTKETIGLPLGCLQGGGWGGTDAAEGARVVRGVLPARFMIKCLGCWVWWLGARVWGLVFDVWGLGLRDARGPSCQGI